jgi:hypothetical protein
LNLYSIEFDTVPNLIKRLNSNTYESKSGIAVQLEAFLNWQMLALGGFSRLINIDVTEADDGWSDFQREVLSMCISVE